MSMHDEITVTMSMKQYNDLLSKIERLEKESLSNHVQMRDIDFEKNIHEVQINAESIIEDVSKCYRDRDVYFINLGGNVDEKS